MTHPEYVESLRSQRNRLTELINEIIYQDPEDIDIDGLARLVSARNGTAALLTRVTPARSNHTTKKLS
jgi:hypothetical protein